MNGIVTLKVRVRVGGKTVDAVLTNDWQTYGLPREIRVPARPPSSRFS